MNSEGLQPQLEHQPEIDKPNGLIASELSQSPPLGAPSFSEPLEPTQVSPIKIDKERTQKARRGFGRYGNLLLGLAVGAAGFGVAQKVLDKPGGPVDQIQGGESLGDIGDLLDTVPEGYVKSVAGIDYPREGSPGMRPEVLDNAPYSPFSLTTDPVDQATAQQWLNHALPNIEGLADSLDIDIKSSFASQVFANPSQNVWAKTFGVLRERDESPIWRDLEGVATDVIADTPTHRSITTEIHEYHNGVSNSYVLWQIDVIRQTIDGQNVWLIQDIQ